MPVSRLVSLASLFAFLNFLSIFPKISETASGSTDLYRLIYR